MLPPPAIEEDVARAAPLFLPRVLHLDCRVTLWRVFFVFLTASRPLVSTFAPRHLLGSFAAMPASALETIDPAAADEL